LGRSGVANTILTAVKASADLASWCYTMLQKQDRDVFLTEARYFNAKEV
jgi:hypothetical protein